MCLAPFCHFPSLPAMVHLDYDAKWRLSCSAHICTFSMRYMACENFQNVSTICSFSWTFQNTQKFCCAINSRGERSRNVLVPHQKITWKITFCSSPGSFVVMNRRPWSFSSSFRKNERCIHDSFSTTIGRTRKFLGVLKSSREAAYCRDVLEILVCHIPHANCTDVCGTWKSSFCITVEVNHGW